MCDVDFLQFSLLVRATCLWQSISVGWALLGHGILALCVTIKKDDAFGSWVCCVSTTCVSWLSTDDSAVKNQGPFSIVIHASNSKRSRENYKMESTMFWVCVCVCSSVMGVTRVTHKWSFWNRLNSVPPFWHFSWGLSLDDPRMMTLEY